jgi:hypothetical protein
MTNPDVKTKRNGAVEKIDEPVDGELRRHPQGIVRFAGEALLPYNSGNLCSSL